MAAFTGITYQDALDTVLGSVEPLPVETVDLVEAFGRALAEDLYADLDLPGFDNSAMDGFAIRSSETLAASPLHPAVLKVVGQVWAGSRDSATVGSGEAVAIATGAPMPPGADTVVRIEDVQADGDQVTIPFAVPAGRDIRRAGEDVRKGSLLLRRGVDASPRVVGLLAALGRSQIHVTGRPGVALLTNGSELVSPGQPLQPGQLYNANLPALLAQTVEAGGRPLALEPVRDDPRELGARIEEALGCDVLVISAGVSVGERDLVRSYLASHGTVQSWRLEMRPVRPFAFGWIGRTLVFGLPGNPVASQLAFELLVRPAIRRLAGHGQTTRPELDAILAQPVENRGGLLTFVRGAVELGGDRPVARAIGNQSTANLAGLAQSDCLIVAPAGCERLEAGALVKIRLLSGNA